MLYPILQEVSRYREMTTVFGGYNHQISCQDGQFYDMKNMSSLYFPVLSPRQNRGIVKTFTNPQGILDKEDMWWVEDKNLYKNGDIITLEGVELTDASPKTLAKMGAYLIIMPDKVWCNTNNLECGYMEKRVEVKGITISVCEASGKAIEWHDAEYYKSHTPKDGDYMMTTTSAGKPSLKVYSATTSIWMTVSSTYLQISGVGIGEGFEKEDGVKISATLTDNNKDALTNVLVNDEGGGIYSTNTFIVDKTDDSITIPGIYKATETDGSDAYAETTFIVERKVPDLAYITECNNRLWGCSADGHEIYCCKLGDVKNWNCFRGMSTDSWAATIGSDGKFTGAITFLGYPMFFKEDSLIKISVSPAGAHQTKETRCRGVQKGSERSLSILNETLYYKSTTSVCGYNGSLPYSISDNFGDERYYDAVGGTVGDRYYISMRDSKDKYHMFVYDSKNGIWCKEDNTEVLFFCRNKDDLYFIDAKDKTMKSVRGTLPYDLPESATEGKFEWFVESGNVGYTSPDNKYVGRINLRITLELGTNVDFYIQYDSSGVWEHKFAMSGKGTRTFSVPITPRRCDHFKYKISGKGGCKIHSITKTIEEGSDS
jgi:hypothetical protein